MGGGQDDFTLGVLARGNTLFFCFFYAVVHTVADNVHDGVLDTVHNGFIHFRVLADDFKAHILAQLLVHVPDNPVHFLEHA